MLSYGSAVRLGSGGITVPLRTYMDILSRMGIKETSKRKQREDRVIFILHSTKKNKI
jgi:hypothetical protein